MNPPINHGRLTPCWPVYGKMCPQRSAYSLLELLIAMGLLAVLLTVAWSLLATFRDAQQRGWSLNQRTQAVRVTREWLEQDLMQLYHSEAIAKFTGNASGFTTVIRPSIDPMPYLEQVLSASQSASQGEQEERGLEDAGSDLSSPTMELPPALKAAGAGLLDSITVQYRLLRVEEQPKTLVALPAANSGLRSARSTEENWKLVRRELGDVPSTPPQASGSSMQSDSSVQSGANFGSGANFESGLELSERTLTVQDLYRASSDDSVSRQSLLKESTVLGISSARFAYWDGRQWSSSWNSESVGKLPIAVSVTLNLSRDQVRLPQPEPSAEIESDFSYDSALAEVSEAADASLSADGAQLDSDRAGQASSDARIVVRLQQATFATPRDTSNSVNSRTSAWTSMGSSNQ